MFGLDNYQWVVLIVSIGLIGWMLVLAWLDHKKEQNRRKMFQN